MALVSEDMFFNHEFKYRLFIIVDCYSRYFEVSRLPDIGSTTCTVIIISSIAILADVELCKDAISGNSRQITPTYVATFANKRDSEHCTSTSNTYPKHTVRCYILKAQYHGPINYVRDSTNYNVMFMRREINIGGN